MIRRAAVALSVAAVALVATGCGDDDDAEAGDVSATCDAVEALGTEVAALPADSTTDDVVAALRGPVETFVEAADDSGDDVLEDLADIYESSFELYRGGFAPAATISDETLDAAAARCLDQGATNDFPEE